MMKTAPYPCYTEIDLNNAIVIELNKLFLELARDDSTDEKTLEIVVQKIHSIGRRVALQQCSNPEATHLKYAARKRLSF